MILPKWWQIALVILLSLLLNFLYLGLGDYNFFLGALMCACLITGCYCSLILDKPELGILSILVAYAFTDKRLEYLSHSNKLIYLAVAILFIHYFMSHITKQKFFWFFAILICSYHILFLIVRPQTSHDWTFSCMQQVAIFLWCILIKWDVKKIMNIVVPYMVYLLAYGFIEKLAINPMRIGGPTTYATNYAVLLVFLWVMWFVYSYLSEKKILILVSMSFLVAFAVFLSGTRMGFLGLLVGFFGAICSKLWIDNLDKSLSQKMFYIIPSLFFGVLLVIGIWLFLPENLLLIKSWNILLSGKLDNSSLGRVACWITAIESFYKEPIWGIGPGNFIIEHTKFLSQLSLISKHSLNPLGHAHSTGLNVLAENGLVGFAVLSIVLIICWVQLIRFLLNQPKNPLGYALFFGGIIIFSLPMIDMIPSPGWDSWFYGILASLGFHKNILSNPKNKLNIKPVS